MQFGEGSSPALFGDTIVIQWDHEGEDFVIALNKETGKEKWKQPREEATSWAAPLIVQHGGQTQVVTSATRKVRSYDLAGNNIGKPFDVDLFEKVQHRLTAPLVNRSFSIR